MSAKKDIALARKLLVGAFESGELEEHEAASVRAAVSSLDGALGIVARPLGTSPISKESQRELGRVTWRSAFEAVHAAEQTRPERKLGPGCYEGFQLRQVLVKGGVDNPDAFMQWCKRVGLVKECSGDGWYFDMDELRKEFEELGL